MDRYQDYIGSKFLDVFFESKSEPIEGLTIIDKMNKLEKLLLIDDAEIWREMREVKNHLTHEYPDDPAIMAKFLNQTYELAPRLLELFENLKKASR